MLGLLAVLASIALVDSLSIVPLCIVFLAVLLGGPKPYLGAASFLAGIYFSYVGAGLLILFGLEAVFDQLDAYLTRLWHQPDPEEIALSIAVGVVLVYAAIRMARRGPADGESRAEVGMPPGKAFMTAVALNLIGLPGAVPYVGAIDQILRADLPVTGMVLSVVFYCTVFVVPLAAVVAVRAILGERSAPVFDAVRRFFDHWGRRLIIALVLVLGLVLIADGIGWFLGTPLIPVDGGGY